MSQNDMVIANALAPAFRTDLNNALQALASCNEGATEPSTTYAGQLWSDTTTDILKIRSKADDAWITIGTLDQTNNLFVPDFNGISFSSQDLIYHDGTDFARLAKGSGNEYLKMNSGATALQWGSIAGGFGVSQQWQNVSRSAGTSYQNTTGKPIMVAVVVTDAVQHKLQVSHNNSTWYDVGKYMTTDDIGQSTVVPDDHYYRVFGGTISSWRELR